MESMGRKDVNTYAAKRSMLLCSGVSTPDKATTDAFSNVIMPPNQAKPRRTSSLVTGTGRLKRFARSFFLSSSASFSACRPRVPCQPTLPYPALPSLELNALLPRHVSAQHSALHTGGTLRQAVLTPVFFIGIHTTVALTSTGCSRHARHYRVRRCNQGGAHSREHGLADACLGLVAARPRSLLALRGSSGLGLLAQRCLRALRLLRAPESARQPKNQRRYKTATPICSLGMAGDAVTPVLW